MLQEFDANAVEIRKLVPSDSRSHDEALDLLKRTQGIGLFSLIKRTNNPKAHTLCAFTDKKLIAVACAEIIDDFDFYKPFDPSITEKLKDRKVGSLCTLSVHENFQGKGIGQTLTKQRMAWLESQGCELVLGISWVSGLPHTSKRIFDKLGFRAVKEVKEFYKEIATQHPFDCPGCKHQPCVCSAIFYDYHFQANHSEQPHDIQKPTHN